MLPATLPIPGFEATTLNRNPTQSQKALLATAWLNLVYTNEYLEYSIYLSKLSLSGNCLYGLWQGSRGVAHLQIRFLSD